MKTQRGLSLIELMIAITIGLVMALGLGTIFIALKKTSDSQGNMSSYQSNQRIAMMFLNTSIRNAGFYVDPVNNTPSSKFPVTTTPVAFSIGQALVGAGAGAGTDTISMRFVADGPIQGCSGALAAGDVYIDQFQVTGGYLQCSETDMTAAAPLTVVVNLVAGLASTNGMNILYGVDTTGAGSVTSYLTGDAVTTNGFWSVVKTVTVALSFTNPLAGQAGQTTNPIAMKQTFSYMSGR